MPTTIYSALRLLTMNLGNPEASQRFGMAEFPDRCLNTWLVVGEIDNRFADKVLMPGLVEGHSHLMEGTFLATVTARP